MAEPVRLEAAWRWIEENARRLDQEEVDAEAACGRIPAAPPQAAMDVPAAPRASEGGYAVRAEETVGAGPYNPLSCPVVDACDGPLPRGAAARIGAGAPLPAGADAILPHEIVEADGERRIAILAPVAAGDRVVGAASELRAGEPLWRPGRRHPLRPAEIGLLRAASVPSVTVVRRPRARILFAGTSDAPEIAGPMLRALVQRDGGIVIGAGRLEDSADPAAGADVAVIVGSSESPPGMAIRGVAIEPGRETCLGRREDAIVVLLPDLPAACFWAYELVAARALRCRGGREPGLPFACRRLRTTRKIASPLGITEIVPVRIDATDPAAIVPQPNGPGRLRDAADADGFVLVPATSEGCPAGTELAVWLFDRVADG